MKYFFAVIILLGLNNSIFCQDQRTIEYNHKITLSNPESYTFNIISESINIVLDGNQINNYVFTTPGIYKIKTSLKNPKEVIDPENDLLPKEITINVCRVKMNFNADTISFSRSITKNKDTNGIIMTIGVSIETYDHKPAVINTAIVKTSGIGTDITAILKAKSNTLPEGNHILQYLLKGKVTENSYLMFDFIDTNNQIQSIALTTPVAN